MFVYIHGRFNDDRILPTTQRYFFLCKCIRNGRYFRNIQVLLHFASLCLLFGFVGHLLVPRPICLAKKMAAFSFFARSSRYLRAGSHRITQTSGQKVTAIVPSCICMCQSVKFYRSSQSVYPSRKSKCRHREDLPIGMLPIISVTKKLVQCGHSYSQQSLSRV